MEYASREDMKSAIRKLDGTELNGRKLRLIEERVGSSRHRRLVDDPDGFTGNNMGLSCPRVVIPTYFTLSHPLTHMLIGPQSISFQVALTFQGQKQESISGQEPQSVSFQFQIPVSFQVQVSLEVKVPERASEEVSEPLEVKGGIGDETLSFSQQVSC